VCVVVGNSWAVDVACIPQVVGEAHGLPLHVDGCQVFGDSQAKPTKVVFSLAKVFGGPGATWPMGGAAAAAAAPAGGGSGGRMAPGVAGMGGTMFMLFLDNNCKLINALLQGYALAAS